MADWAGDEEEAFQFVRYPPPEMIGGSPPARERVVRALLTRAREAGAASAHETYQRSINSRDETHAAEEARLSERIAELEGEREHDLRVALDWQARAERARAVVEAARWEYDQGLATPHLCRALAAHDRGES